MLELRVKVNHWKVPKDSARAMWLAHAGPTPVDVAAGVEELLSEGAVECGECGELAEDVLGNGIVLEGVTVEVVDRSG